MQFKEEADMPLVMKGLDILTKQVLHNLGCGLLTNQCSVEEVTPKQFGLKLIKLV
jgi:hypothetical protein